MSLKKSTLFLGILFAAASFAVAHPAQASSKVQIALTATTQLPPVSISATEVEYRTQKFKITNKDILQALTLRYPDALFRGVTLTLADSGEFEIRNPGGELLTTIALVHLRMDGVSPQVAHLVSNTATGVDTYKNISAQYRFALNLATAYAFEIRGGQSGQRQEKPDVETWIYRYQLAGLGAWMGRQTLIEGRIVVVGRNIVTLS